MNVARTQQNEVAGHKRISRSVDDIRAGSVDRRGEFPVAVTVQNTVVVPQKSGDFVGAEFGYYFLNANVFHILILPIFAHFVNF